MWDREIDMVSRMEWSFAVGLRAGCGNRRTCPSALYSSTSPGKVGFGSRPSEHLAKGKPVSAGSWRQPKIIAQICPRRRPTTFMSSLQLPRRSWRPPDRVLGLGTSSASVSSQSSSGRPNALYQDVLLRVLTPSFNFLTACSRQW